MISFLSYSFQFLSINFESTPLIEPSIEGAYTILDSTQSAMEYCSGRVHPTARDINHTVPSKSIWIIIARDVIAQILFLFRARMNRKLKDTELRNTSFYVDINFHCIEGQGLTTSRKIDSENYHIQVVVNINHYQNLLCFLTTLVHELAHILVFITSSNERLDYH